jgi:hypothetical protein
VLQIGYIMANLVMTHSCRPHPYRSIIMYVKKYVTLEMFFFYFLRVIDDFRVIDDSYNYILLSQIMNILNNL